jgi:hypothetical protein
MGQRSLSGSHGCPVRCSLQNRSFLLIGTITGGQVWVAGTLGAWMSDRPSYKALRAWSGSDYRSLSASAALATAVERRR